MCGWILWWDYADSNQSSQRTLTLIGLEVFQKHHLQDAALCLLLLFSFCFFKSVINFSLCSISCEATVVCKYFWAKFVSRTVGEVKKLRIVFIPANLDPTKPSEDKMYLLLLMVVSRESLWFSNRRAGCVLDAVPCVQFLWPSIRALNLLQPQTSSWSVSVHLCVFHLLLCCIVLE